MVLTEPEAGSDLQSVKLEAYQDDDGQWRLRGVKRFISNGCGNILLALARSEPNTNNLFGLSLFAVQDHGSIKISRLEEKMGLHGSPTCELHFEDTPAELIGKRRYGLIKYTMFCLQHARFSVAAQALGIADQAYAEALDWAKTRRQFGSAIYEKPPVMDDLIEMRVRIESCRTLLYKATQWMDLRNKLEEKIEILKETGEPCDDEKARFDKADKLVDMLSGLVKYVVSEEANKVCYDAVQLHGGTGYIRETRACQLALDVRITNIYEGTSHIHVIGSTKGVVSDLLGEYFDEMAGKTFTGELAGLADHLQEIRQLFLTSVQKVQNHQDGPFREVAAKQLVDMYTWLYTGYLLLEEAEVEERKLLIARRYIKKALANSRASVQSIDSELYADLGEVETILG
jgi:hypothetical protein